MYQLVLCFFVHNTRENLREDLFLTKLRALVGQWWQTSIYLKDYAWMLSTIMPSLLWNVRGVTESLLMAWSDLGWMANGWKRVWCLQANKQIFDSQFNDTDWVPCVVCSAFCSVLVNYLCDTVFTLKLMCK